MPDRYRERATHDPFAITPDPSVYVPRAATETARKQLLRSACNPAKTTALIGPPGFGKTLLLHLLAEEVPEDLQTVYLPYAALPPEELCGWALGLLALPGTEDPIGALRAHSLDLRERKSSLLLLIDDAGAMPVATARWAGRLVQDSRGCVRLAIAASDNAAGNRTIAAIGSNFDVVHLDEPMTESETKKYIVGRLALARVPDSIRAHFDDPTVRLLHRISAGIPRRLHSAAAGILQEAPIATAGDRYYTPNVVKDVPTAPVEPVASAQTLGAPGEERRVLNRRAEPEGVAVRVGLGGPPSQKGRRAEDQIEPAPQTSEPATEDQFGSAPQSSGPAAEDQFGSAPQSSGSAAEDQFGSAPQSAPAAEDQFGSAPQRSEFAAESELIATHESAEPAPIEEDAFDDDWAPDRELPVARPISRRAPSASRLSIVLGTLLVAFAAVSIPLIRAIVSGPRASAGIDRQGAPGESARLDSRQSGRDGLGEATTGGLRASGETAAPDASLAREEIAGIPSAVRKDDAPSLGSSASAPPRAKSLGSFAVQINASPWANVEIDGIDLGATPLANIPLLGGAHSFRVRMPDGRVIERIIEIDAERRFISFE